MAETNDRPFLIFRQSRENRYTLPVLLGAMEKEGLHRYFQIRLARSAEEILFQIGSLPAIIGFSFMTPQIQAVGQEVERLRQVLQEKAILLAGGPHPSGDPKGTLALGFDYVFSGPAERIFPLFLRHFLKGARPSQQLVRDEQCPIFLDDYPPFSSAGRYFSPIEITRGCLYRCLFCQTPQIFGQSLGHRSPEAISNALRQAIPRGYGQAAFRSPNAFAYLGREEGLPDLEAIEKLFKACRLEGVQGIHFGCFPSEVRPDWVTPDALQLVKKYCRNRTIVLGAQSGSDTLLSRLNRRHNAQQALQACRWIHEARFTPHVDFVFGFPEETMEDRRLSLSLMELMIQKHGARIHAHSYLPLPGTPLFRKEPSQVDSQTKNALAAWEGKGKLDGWWREQEGMAWQIIRWRDEGKIQCSSADEGFAIDS